MADDEVIEHAVCSPTSAIPYPGSFVRWCFFCACEVWVSPSTTKKVDAGKTKPMCEECAAGHMSQNPDERIVMPDHVRRDLRGIGYSDEIINAVASGWANEMRKGNGKRP